MNLGIQRFQFLEGGSVETLARLDPLLQPLDMVSDLLEGREGGREGGREMEL